ncbi:ADP-ribosylation factor GTPase-activating protein [Thecamonas trahens ATCC 50062]|uniref:ADP-ribosylation factor GTPase-activating protein n=1 Tax=Thecamonas trahens ATCC 50062 TaxID=461836 RepID=A0A0L0DI78_THETB|nr:ADP-ribosylation factor GTPase-activating protein [Thecamonas trahens ATCC 50062]KNC51806.1 ADP-ribosylation factor GTPase-activating protein [Thecamonas trahens ATCC 50062]|eukprot:XP_013755673.1 ADP-ribosylation factor GTPase-activating protein [Thecamonas trahens ATCC 50062]
MAESYLPEFEGFFQDEANCVCADCGAADPRWASTNLGAVVCIECSGVHRNLGVHITKMRSVVLDDWESEMLEAFLAKGNAVVNAEYEAEVPEGWIKPGPDASRAARTDWISAKYANKAFVPGNETLPRTEAENAELAARGASEETAAGGLTAMQEYIGTVAVELLEGKDLVACDVSGKSDPYVKFSLGAQQLKSKIKKKSLNPVWGETFMFCVPHFGAELHLDVMDWDKLSADDSMGSASVAITEEMETEGGHSVWVDLNNTKSGSIHLRLTYTSLVH